MLQQECMEHVWSWHVRHLAPCLPLAHSVSYLMLYVALIALGEHHMGRLTNRMSCHYHLQLSLSRLAIMYRTTHSQQIRALVERRENMEG